MGSQETSSFEIVGAGPFRIIGISYTGKAESSEMQELWDRKFLPRLGEIQKPAAYAGFGVCRCVPGAKDGTFEYIAAVEADANSPVPEGMMEVEIPRGDYAVISVPNLSEIMQGWQSAAAAVAAAPEWEAYCGPAGCECATHPCFEFYPPGYKDDGPFSIYIPVRRKAS
ncbi:MAG: GyrI-like domain-containing protein [bacterium]|jgi:predicted transcriptional regulator YdeE